MMNANNAWPSTRVTLVHRIRDPEDQEAWRSFVELYAPLVFRYCRKRGVQAADAQNITQDVFLHVSRSMRRFQYDVNRGPFRNWLGLIIHQRLARHYKRRVAAVRAIEVGGKEFADNCQGDLDSEWLDLFNAHVYQIALARVRSEFDAVSWRVFERVWEQGASPAEVAGELDRDTSWIYLAKHRVMKRLQEEVSRLADDAGVICREPLS